MFRQQNQNLGRTNICPPLETSAELGKVIALHRKKTASDRTFVSY
jgi:hypothetical protein